jgi:hypothetical protein
MTPFYNTRGYSPRQQVQKRTELYVQSLSKTRSLMSPFVHCHRCSLAKLNSIETKLDITGIFLSSDLRCHGFDDSEEYMASMFRVEVKAKQRTRKRHKVSSVNTVLRNMGSLYQTRLR